MELRQLAVVVAVAEEGGFTAAAVRLRTVQSTVSTVVRALERDLGTPLFHRTTHQVVLTPAGEAFMPAARAALEAAARARAAVSPVGGRVRLGVCPGLLTDWHRVLAALRHVHPGLVVEVRQVLPGEVERALAESTVDVVLTAVAGCGAASPSINGFAAAPHGELATDGFAPGDPTTGLTTPRHDLSATGPAAPTHESAASLAAPAPAHNPPTADPAAPTHKAAASLAAPTHKSAASLAEPTHESAASLAAPAHHPPTSDPASPTHEPAANPLPPGELVTTPLPHEELILATAPGGSRSAPAELSELSLVDFPPGWAIREAVDRAFPCRRLSLEVDDLAVAAGLVRAGLAACVLPASATSRFPDLTVRRFDRPPPWQLAAVYRGVPSPAVAALLAQLG
ncbi:Transcriptional regulator [Amycolatopsis camponoti]|uniref:Transcriptional regulator n=1 Tax=Amycolatopsis camponoti TaxID=2606593 RepID=A0A6I8LPN4_9PSEU|nr:LysR family transcriptional regulator [Amycolatopsis camponoti]VVJ18980.1 Transcriptional regulator [Amycolatopsis camponoti]